MLHTSCNAPSRRYSGMTGDGYSPVSETVSAVAAFSAASPATQNSRITSRGTLSLRLTRPATRYCRYIPRDRATQTVSGRHRRPRHGSGVTSEDATAKRGATRGDRDTFSSMAAVYCRVGVEIQPAHRTLWPLHFCGLRKARECVCRGLEPLKQGHPLSDMHTVLRAGDPLAHLDRPFGRQNTELY